LYEASFTQDDKRIITFSYDNRVQVWDVASGQSIGEPLPHPGRLKSVPTMTEEEMQALRELRNQDIDYSDIPQRLAPAGDASPI